MRHSQSIYVFLENRMHSFLVATLVLGAPIAFAASPFDGNWKGEGRPTSACSEKAELRFAVKDGELVQFSLVGPRGSATTVKGTVSESGTAAIEYGTRRLPGNLVFKDSTFEGKLETFCGLREFTGARE